MDYSTFDFEFSCDADGVIFDVDSLYAHFEALTDKRDRRGLRYPLPVILVALTLGKMSGEDKPKGIAMGAFASRPFHSGFQVEAEQDAPSQYLSQHSTRWA